MNAFISEFKEYRNLTPIKILVHGPPFSGKTSMAKKLAAHYELHYLDPEQVAKETYAFMEQRANSTDEEDEDLEALKEKFNELKETLKTNNGKFMDDQIVQFMRDKLMSMPCRNQGYVIDCFPNTLEDCATLFQPGEDEESGDDKIPPFNKIVFPQHIIALELSDEVIKERVMALPEAETAGTKNAEEGITYSTSN